MAYQHDKRRKGFKKSADYMDNTQFHSTDSPQREGAVNGYLSVKALRNLPKSSYAIQADPYDASLPTSDPYPIINSFNKKIGGNYAGNRNLDGGNVQQYPNSVRSSMLKAFDYLKLNLSLNYRFRPMRLSALPTDVGPDDPYVGSGLIDECRQSIAEAVSVLQSTTFTQMAIYNYAIETDMAMGTAIRTEVEDADHVKHYVYEGLTDVIFASTTFYQLVIQEILNVVNYHNAFRLKMGTAIRTSWNRETPQLNNLFGLFKKKSFLSLIDSLCLSFPGEYVDKQWAEQINMVTSMLSRRSNAILDPTLEVQGRHVRPTVFKMYIMDSEGHIDFTQPVFDLGTDFTKSIVVGGETVSMTLWDAIDYIKENLSAYKVVEWARNHVSYQDADAAYFNAVNARFSQISLCLTTFKTLFNDIREVLDVVARTGLVTWSKGFRPSITKDTDAPLFDNKLVDDIFKTVFSGSVDVVFDEHTKRLRTYSIWNMYEGIPEYDANAGGCFLTLSGKQVNLGPDLDNYKKYLPIMCFYDSSIVGSTETGVLIQAVARDGTKAYIKADNVTIQNDENLNRLAPLTSQSTQQVRVPKFYASADYTLDTSHKSYLVKALETVFGVVKNSAGSISVDSDVVAIYSIELEDITNDAIAYARATSPFRGSYGYEGNLGFSTFGQK